MKEVFKIFLLVNCSVPDFGTKGIHNAVIEKELKGEYITYDEAKANIKEALEGGGIKHNNPRLIIKKVFTIDESSNKFTTEVESSLQ